MSMSFSHILGPSTPTSLRLRKCPLNKMIKCSNKKREEKEKDMEAGVATPNNAANINAANINAANYTARFNAANNAATIRDISSAGIFLHLHR